MISHRLILFFQLDFLDNDGTHHTNGGIIGNMSLGVFDEPAVSAVQTLASRGSRGWKIIAGGAISRSVTVCCHVISIRYGFVTKSRLTREGDERHTIHSSSCSTTSARSESASRSSPTALPCVILYVYGGIRCPADSRWQRCWCDFGRVLAPCKKRPR